MCGNYVVVLLTKGRGGPLLMTTSDAVSDHRPRRILIVSTIAFTLAFAAWLMLGVLGIPIRKEFGLTDVELSWLVAAAILSGSLWRLPFGIITDRIGGRKIMTVLLLAIAVPTYMVSRAETYEQLIVLALLFGLAGNAFNVGISWNSAWFPRERQGTALGVFGAGNVGASVTKLIGPTLISVVPAAGLLGGLFPGGWRFVPVLYAVLLVLMAAIVWFGTPAADKCPGHGRSLRELMRPLRNTRVWRFSLYYVIVFGAYVALSAWLPKYYVDVYHLELGTAALLTALFIFPASLLRPLGGWLSDRFGARRIMYLVFAIMTGALILLSAPSGHIVLQVSQSFDADGLTEVLPFSLGVVPFTVAVILLGVGMGIGKAAVYKHIPEYFPNDVGAVGGLVGLIGALGGFFLPPMFAWSFKITGLPQSTFAILLVVTIAGFLWMHRTVLMILRAASPHVSEKFEHPHVSAVTGH